MIEQILDKAKAASRELVMVDRGAVDNVLAELAEAVRKNTTVLIEANRRDLERMEKSDPLYDRLLLTAERLGAIASDIENVASLRSPVGDTIESVARPNGMVIDKVRVPFGVVGVIYEARPNVTLDVASLCLKTSNAVLLKGGSDAVNSNEAIVTIIRDVLSGAGIDPDCVQLLPADRQATAELLNAVGYVDLVIPRGSSSLIQYVRDNSRVPVIETGAGICHTYFDLEGDVNKGRDIIFNAKTRRVSVCNALDCLLIHSARLPEAGTLCRELASKEVVIYADHPSYGALKHQYPDHLLEHAREDSYGTEFLDYKLAVKCVESADQAIEHISIYSSRHSEAIITENEDTAAMFCRKVDAACVYHNVSTAFTDGAQFGMGAEIGISTQKMHARGPMALAELTTYKYIITGDGQVRE